MELSVAGVLATLGDRVSSLIVDCSWNVDAAIIARAAVPFVRALRAGGLGKNVSVWLVEGLPFGRNWAVPADASAQAASNAALRAAYEELVTGGDAHVFYGPLTGEQFGPDALLDSLSLVSLIVDVESGVSDRFGQSVSLTDDEAMGQAVSPFASVSALTDYVVKLLARA